MENISKPELLNDLCRRVTEEIELAERPAADTSAEEQIAAWNRLSLTEEAIAEHPAASEVEKSIGRRGAINAALEAHDLSRAQFLAGRYKMAEFLAELLAK